MRVVGVIGTMVWDEIWRDSDPRSPVEEWGGISYALAAADALRQPGLRVRPIIKLGSDLAERGFGFMRHLSVLDTVDTVSVAEGPNPRVEIHYTKSQVRRCERLTGGVPPWTWSELEPRLRGCDALYVNFITGGELELGVAQQIRSSFGGPIYADLHSLMLTTGPQGERSPRPLARWAEWLRCFDVVQLNEDELTTLAAPWGDPWAFAADVVGKETRLLFVTLGPRGAAYVVAPGALPLWAERSLTVEGLEPVRSGRLPVEPLGEGDPTGCGDVWGVTSFCALLDERSVEDAIRLANEAATRNAAHQGATGLNRFLRGEIERA